MKVIFVIIMVATVYCLYKLTESDREVYRNNIKHDTIVYTNSDYRMILYSVSNMILEFQIYNFKTKMELAGKAELILVNGEMPEGSLREDHNNPYDYKGYECEYAYQYIRREIKIAFALEKKLLTRLDLTIYDSEYEGFIDGSYTLVKQDNRKIK